MKWGHLHYHYDMEAFSSLGICQGSLSLCSISDTQHIVTQTHQQCVQCNSQESLNLKNLLGVRELLFICIGIRPWWFNGSTQICASDLAGAHSCGPGSGNWGWEGGHASSGAAVTITTPCRPQFTPSLPNSIHSHLHSTSCTVLLVLLYRSGMWTWLLTTCGGGGQATLNGMLHLNGVCTSMYGTSVAACILMVLMKIHYNLGQVLPSNPSPKKIQSKGFWQDVHIQQHSTI